MSRCRAAHEPGPLARAPTAAVRPTDLDVWPGLPLEFGRCHTAEQHSDADLRPGLHPEVARCRVAEKPADMGLQQVLQPELQGVTLPSCRTAERPAVSCHAAVQPTALYIWPGFAPEFARCNAAEQFADIDLRIHVRPQLGRCHAAAQPADLDLWPQFQTQFARCRTAEQPAEIDLRTRFPPGLERCCSDQQHADIDLWLQVQPERARCHDVSLLSSPQTSTSVQGFFQSSDGIAPTSSLQTSIFGYKSNQNVHGVTMCHDGVPTNFGFCQSLRLVR